MTDARRPLGQAAEEAAARFLRGAGLVVVERNVRFHEGEIDLVCREAGVVVFVEVKYRGRTARARGAESVSGGQRRRLGHITKQGNSLLRFLLVEAAQVTVRSDPEWRSKYFHLAMRRGRKIAKVAMARKLAVRLYWMWRKGWDYEQ